MAQAGVTGGPIEVRHRHPRRNSGTQRGSPDSHRRIGRWRACLSKLDEAKSLDPSGDAQPEIQSVGPNALRNVMSPSVIARPGYLGKTSDW